jgi:hypothetical protein
MTCARDGRKAFEQDVDRFACFQIVEQGLHRHPRPVGHRSAAHDIGLPEDNGLFHCDNLRPIQPRVQRFRLRRVL